MRPVIGITASFSQDIYVQEIKEPRYEHQYTYHSYVKAVLAGGGNPIIIPVGIGPEPAVEVLKRISGLILTGGPDVGPNNYNHSPGPNQTRLDLKKDETELALAKAALERWTPIFGICRGLQILAIAAGGNLIQDIESDIPWAEKHNYKEMDPEGFHDITMKENSALWHILGEKAKVTSCHHQAVGEMPDDWKVTAESADGVVEGMEFSLEPLIFGVQWHPEELWQTDPPQLNIFKSFVNSCLI